MIYIYIFCDILLFYHFIFVIYYHFIILFLWYIQRDSLGFCDLGKIFCLVVRNVFCLSLFSFPSYFVFIFFHVFVSGRPLILVVRPQVRFIFIFYFLMFFYFFHAFVSGRNLILVVRPQMRFIFIFLIYFFIFYVFLCFFVRQKPYPCSQASNAAGGGA